MDLAHNLRLAGCVRVVNDKPALDGDKRAEGGEVGTRKGRRAGWPGRREGYIGCIGLSIPYFPRSANRKMELVRPEDPTKATYWLTLLWLQMLLRDTSYPRTKDYYDLPFEYFVLATARWDCQYLLSPAP